jgi:hypothetical protein
MLTASLLLKSPLVFLLYVVGLSVIAPKRNKKGVIEITKSQMTWKYGLFHLLMMVMVTSMVFLTVTQWM